jgi:hypothetical protein
MAYASASDVAVLVRNIMGTSASFDSATCPTLTQVNTWLTTGCGVINTKIAQYGYGPIPTSSEAYGLAQQANAAYGAWWTERSRTLSTVRAEERTRADMFKKDFFDLLDLLCEIDLGSVGVAKSSGVKPRVHAGGISVDGKDTLEQDTDRVTPRFKRGMFGNPEAVDAGDLGTQGGDPQEHT